MNEGRMRGRKKGRRGRGERRDDERKEEREGIVERDSSGFRNKKCSMYKEQCSDYGVCSGVVQSKAVYCDAT